MFKEKPKVLVAGAGPVGMFAALALSKRGIKVQIVDTGLWACSHSYALALHPSSLELLKDLGLHDKVLQNACPVRSIALCDADGPKARIALNDGDSGGSLAVVRQSVIEDLFETELGHYDTEIQWRHEVYAVSSEVDHATATVNKFEKDSRGYIVAHTEWTIAKTSHLEVQFVLGADGHNSQVRRAIGLDFPEIAPAQYYAVFEFKTDADLGNELRLVLGEETTDVLWPLPDGYCRWGFRLPDYSDTESEQFKDRLLAAGFGHFPTKRLKDRAPASNESIDQVELDEGALKMLIAERAPWFQGSIGQMSWRTIVRFERRQASAFGKGRAWLAGDAAHLTLPTGVQSMNLGLLEANQLADSFADIINGSGSISNLQTYDDRWAATWRQLHGLESGLRATSSTDPWIAARTNRLMACLPAHGAALAPLAAKLGLEVTSRITGA